MAVVHDASLTIRLPKALLDAWRDGVDDPGRRVRYLLERDLKERERKRGGSGVKLSALLATDAPGDPLP